MPEPLKAVMFDLDGTLCEYRIKPFDALRLALAAQGLKAWMASNAAITRDRFSAQLKAVWKESQDLARAGQLNAFAYGASTETVRRTLTQAGLPTARVETLQEAYLATMVEHLQLREGAQRVVQALSGRYRLALLTNGPSRLQWSKIDRLGIRPWFAQVVVSDDVGVRKPDPKIFQILLKRLKLPAAQTLYVGDTLQYDVLGATRAGVRSVWLNPQARPPLPQLPAPEVTIERLEQLLDWLTWREKKKDAP